MPLLTLYSVCCIHCQVVSIIFIGVGSWAHSEKDKYNTLDSLSFDPSVLLIVTGVFLFLVAFCGCIGALRENNILLKIVSDKYSCHPSFSWMTKVQIANKVGVLCLMQHLSSYWFSSLCKNQP